MNVMASGRVFRIGMLTVLSAAAMMLAGCWNRSEVNDLALVTGAALDKTEDNKIELSVQVYVPRAGGAQSGMSSGGGGGGGGGNQTIVRSASGITLAEAMTKLQEELPRKIFWGHTDIYVFGEKVAKEGIRNSVDFLIRFPQHRERAAVFVSKGIAKKTLQFHPPLERASSEVLREMAKSHLSLDVDLKELAQMLSGNTGAAALPWVELLPPSAEQERKQAVPYVHGTAVFKRDKLAGQLDDVVTRGMLWVRDEIQKEAVITFKPDEAEGFISFSLANSHTSLKPEIRDGKWSVSLEIETDQNIVQNATDLDMMSPKLVKSLEEQLDEEIQDRVERAVAEAKEMKADIFNFAEVFHRKYPKQWNQVKDHWEDKFVQIDVRMEIHARIKRPGSITSGGNRPKDEVRKQ